MEGGRELNAGAEPLHTRGPGTYLQFWDLGLHQPPPFPRLAAVPPKACSVDGRTEGGFTANRRAPGGTRGHAQEREECSSGNSEGWQLCAQAAPLNSLPSMQMVSATGMRGGRGVAEVLATGAVTSAAEAVAVVLASLARRWDRLCFDGSASPAGCGGVHGSGALLPAAKGTGPGAAPTSVLRIAGHTQTDDTAATRGNVEFQASSPRGRAPSMPPFDRLTAQAHTLRLLCTFE